MKKLYIANRGEIACRIIRTARRMGIHTIVGYSEADAQALFVQQADEAHLLGGPLPKDSYLNAAKVLEIAHSAGADAIHPGYGFLSENTEFARHAINVGLKWVGPAPDVINRMGNKENARDFMGEHSVPLVPGFDGLHTHQEIKDAAMKTGFPLLLKAAMGGGGIGMKRVESEEELDKAIDETMDRSARAFGSAQLFVEKFIESPHHVEIQIFGSAAGKVYTLPERECSVQRRHQKVIEESPSPFATDASRKALQEAAHNGADALGYENAGTMEFLLGSDQHAYFLEVNTRLQVEHPITEEITNLDLVELQLRTAMGEDVGEELENVRVQGHAIECRLYAENPKNFYPAPGTIETLQWPAGEGIRIDTGVQQGDTITPYYDPMIAKIIAHGDDRAQALARMQQAVDALVIEGLKTNQSFLQEMLAHDSFVQGQYDTGVLYELRPKLRGKA